MVVSLGRSFSIWKEFDLCDKYLPLGSCNPDKVEFSDQNGCTLRFTTTSFTRRQMTKDDFVDRDGNCKSRSSNWRAVASVKLVEPGKVKLGKVEPGKVKRGKAKKKISLKIAAAEPNDRSA